MRPPAGPMSLSLHERIDVMVEALNPTQAHALLAETLIAKLGIWRFKDLMAEAEARQKAAP